jgi:hypothetical protein
VLGYFLAGLCSPGSDPFIGQHDNSFIGFDYAILQFLQAILDNRDIAVRASIQLDNQSSDLPPDPCNGITIVKGTHNFHSNPYDEQN